MFDTLNIDTLIDDTRRNEPAHTHTRIDTHTSRTLSWHLTTFYKIHVVVVYRLGLILVRYVSSIGGQFDVGWLVVG